MSVPSDAKVGGRSELAIPASDGYELAALYLTPEGAPRGALQIHSGIGAKKEFYLPFAEFLVGRGFAAVLFDYRGVGGSCPPSLRGFDARMSDWGLKDMTGVADWLAERHPAVPRFVVAHSMGGQLFGLMRNHHLFDGMVTVATATAYWRAFPFPQRYLPAFMWFVYMPIVSRVLGYVPTKALGFGENLANGIGLEWASWCRTEAYISREFGRTIPEQYYDEVRVPIAAYVMEDDYIATEKSAPKFLRYYRNAPVELETLRTADAAAPKVGHFGFFRRRVGAPLWERPAAVLDEWVAKRKQPVDAGAAPPPGPQEGGPPRG